MHIEYPCVGRESVSSHAHEASVANAYQSHGKEERYYIIHVMRQMLLSIIKDLASWSIKTITLATPTLVFPRISDTPLPPKDQSHPPVRIIPFPNPLSLFVCH